MVMLEDPSVKYKKFQPIHLPNRQWPSKTLDKPPRWLSTDLRDGNQSLPDPMSVEQKKEYFLKLVEIGFKEIEVAFPSASQVDYDFTRWAVLNAPPDVSIQVLSPCREELIKRTVESLKGAKRATVHIYLATSDCFRNIIFGMSQDESVELATKCSKLVRELTKDDPSMQETEWDFEFSPETFSDTSPEFALKICESVKAAWDPTVKNPIIFNLPATVEMSTPNVYADQIEFFSTNISEREKVCISLHPHNDRGCAVAAAELAQLGGADRVEGCLFGNGERTGNVDLVTLALNLYTQGISPNLDFSDINSVVDIVERCNKIPVHARAPYGGQLVVCAFSGSHQDAIKKGFKIHQQAVGADPTLKWEIPYLPIDPTDIGRTYEAIIRVNSQSGKGGASWIILRNLELDLPRGLQIEFSKKVQNATEEKGKELISDEIVTLFYNSFILNDDSCKVKLIDYDLIKLDQNSREIDLTISLNGEKINIQGKGNGPLSAFTKAISDHFGVQFSVLKYHEHSLGKDSNSKAATYIECSITTLQNQVINKWGVGIHEDISQASYLSLISILNSAVNDGVISV